MRSCRQSSQKLSNASDDEEFLASDDEQAVEPSAPGVTLIVEKILGKKMVPDESKPGTSTEMFFIKWRGLSWLWVSWETKADIESVDPQGR